MNKENFENSMIQAINVIDGLQNNHMFLGKDIDLWLKTLFSQKLKFWEELMKSDYAFDIKNYSKYNQETQKKNIIRSNKNVEILFDLIKEDKKFLNDIEKCFIAGVLACIVDRDKKISWVGIELKSQFDLRDINLINALYYFTFAFLNHVDKDIIIEFDSNKTKTIVIEYIDREIVFKRLSGFLKAIEIDLESLGLF